MAAAAGPRGGPEVLLWGWRDASNDASFQDSLLLHLFHPAAPLASIACGGGLAAFVTEDQHAYLMELPPPPGALGRPHLVSDLRDAETAQVSCGASHVAAVTADGAARALQRPDAARAGGSPGARGGEALAAEGRLPRLYLPGRATRISCGGTHCLVLIEGGALFAFGEGLRGQLGLGEGAAATRTPERVQGLEHLQVVDIAAGTSHSCAATSFGNLFAWGCNRHGQLGDGSTQATGTPHLVGALRGVSAVAASAATAALCDGGVVFAWGFAGHPEPTVAFDMRANAIALSHDAVICALCRGGCLVAKRLGSTHGAVVLADAGVTMIAAAASGHILAVSGAGGASATPRAANPASLPASPTSLSMQDVLGRGPGGGSSAGIAARRRALRAEAAELHAASHCEARALDELCGESCLETVRLKAVVDQAEARAAEVAAQLATERAMLTRRQGVARLLDGQLEVQRYTEEVAGALASFNPKDADDGRPAGGARLASVARDLRLKHRRLEEEGRQFREESEALQQETLFCRGEAARSEEHLERLGVACASARAALERQRAAAVAAQRAAGAAEEALQQLNSVSNAPVSPEDDAGSLRDEEEQHRALAARLRGAIGQLRGERARHEAGFERMRQLDAEARARRRGVCAEPGDWPRGPARVGPERLRGELRRRLADAEAWEAGEALALQRQAADFQEAMSPLYEALQARHLQLAGGGRG